jgi:hypothetical protein
LNILLLAESIAAAFATIVGTNRGNCAAVWYAEEALVSDTGTVIAVGNNTSDWRLYFDCWCFPLVCGRNGLSQR